MLKSSTDNKIKQNHDKKKLDKLNTTSKQMVFEVHKFIPSSSTKLIVMGINFKSS